MKQYLLVVNPCGGDRKSERLLDAVRPILEAAPARLTVQVTAYRGHARDLLNQIDPGGYDAVILLGGDGTLHEAVNGMLARRDGVIARLGLIPGGSGNSFVQDLGCADPLQAAARIVAGVPRPVDAMRVTTPDGIIYAANIVGWGLVTDINILAERLRWMGANRYSASTLARIATLKRRSARFVVDGREEKDSYVFAMACNSQHTGKGMRLAPSAKLDDGLIDLVMVRNASRLQLLKMFPRVFDGTHVSSPVVEYRQVSSISIYPEVDEVLNIDGELTGTTPLEIEVLPAAIRILA